MAKIKEAQENTKRENHRSRHLQRKNWNTKLKEASRNTWKRGSWKRASSNKEPEDEDGEVQELEKREVQEPDKICKHSAALLSNSVQPQMNPAALFRYLVFLPSFSSLLAWWIWTKRGQLKEPSPNHNLRGAMASSSTIEHFGTQQQRKSWAPDYSSKMPDTIWIQKTK